MEKYKKYLDRSKEKVISEQEKIIKDLKQKNLKLWQLNQFWVEISNLHHDKLDSFITRMTKEITGAKFTVFSEYNSEKKSLSVQHFELEPGLVEKVINLVGSQITKMEVPVNNDIYNTIIKEIIGFRATLYESTFGSIPPVVCNALQKLLKVDRFIGIAYLIEGKLYGTSLLGMRKGTVDPSMQILENIVFLVGLALRRRKAEIALMESKTHISAILEAMPDLMFLQNKDGVYLDYHAPDASLLYVPPETFIGKNMKDILPDEIVTNFQNIFNEAIKTKEARNFEYSLTIPRGKAYFETRTVALDENKVLSIIRDITKRKEAELQIQRQNQDLLKLNEDKDRFMSILAHDLKSPFNSILGLLDLLSINLHKYNIEKISQMISSIRNSSHHFYNLLESLLIWVRSHHGKMPVNIQRINIIETCYIIVEELKLNANAKSIEIRLLDHDNKFAFADVEMIKTILRNLISNAIKFSHPNGEIHIYTEDEPDKLIVVISDTGIGMTQEKLQTLFDISNYHSTHGTAGETGTGLGLVLCKDLIEKNYGEIWVESTPDVGSTFRFSLPGKHP